MEAIHRTLNEGVCEQISEGFFFYKISGIIYEGILPKATHHRISKVIV